MCNLNFFKKFMLKKEAPKVKLLMKLFYFQTKLKQLFGEPFGSIVNQGIISSALIGTFTCIAALHWVILIGFCRRECSTGNQWESPYRDTDCTIT